MKITVINNFGYSPGNSKSVGRYLFIAEELAKRGHEVTYVISDFDHAKKEYIKEEFGNQYKSKIVQLHVPSYGDNISYKRLLSHYIFGRKVSKLLKESPKPEVIFCHIPSMTAAVKAAEYCKKNGVKYIIDVMDIWPEVFYMSVKNKFVRFLMKPLEWYVNKAYSAADEIVAVSQTYADRALSVNKKVKHGLSVFIGNDGEIFDKSRDNRMVQYNDGKLRIAYIGTVGYSYDIPCFLRALKLYKDNHCQPEIKFVVMGDGPKLVDFKQMAKDLGVDAEFTGRIAYEDMVGRLCSCDMLANCIVKGAQQSMTNKVGDYALSGLPVINTQENLEYRSYVEDLQLGINCRCGNDQDVFEAMKTLANKPELRKKYGENQRKFGVERFDRRYSYIPIFELIEKE